VKNEQQTEKQLDQAIAKLPRELLPEQDLWLQLEPQLTPRSAARRGLGLVSRPWAAAAALVVAVVLAWRVLLIPDNGGTQIAGNDFGNGYVASHQTVIEEFETIKAETLGNVGTVSEYFGDWHYQMAVWDQAIEQVRDALEYYPDEPLLLSQMSGLYQQQLNYLQMVSVVDTNEYSWMGNEP
jgi:hypothetical protein